VSGIKGRATRLRPKKGLDKQHAAEKATRGDEGYLSRQGCEKGGSEKGGGGASRAFRMFQAQGELDAKRLFERYKHSPVTLREKTSRWGRYSNANVPEH